MKIITIFFLILVTPWFLVSQEDTQLNDSSLNYLGLLGVPMHGPTILELSSQESNSDSSMPFYDLYYFMFLYLLHTTFGPYPYAEGGFICHATENPNFNSLDPKSERYIPATDKNSWYSVESQFINMANLGNGTWITFKGIFYRLFGPYVEAWISSDGDTPTYAFRIGGMITGIQTDPLILSAYFQYQQFSGYINGHLWKLKEFTKEG